MTTPMPESIRRKTTMPPFCWAAQCGHWCFSDGQHEGCELDVCTVGNADDGRRLPIETEVALLAASRVDWTKYQYLWICNECCAGGSEYVGRAIIEALPETVRARLAVVQTRADNRSFAPRGVDVHYVPTDPFAHGLSPIFRASGMIHAGLRAVWVNNAAAPQHGFREALSVAGVRVVLHAHMHRHTVYFSHQLANWSPDVVVPIENYIANDLINEGKIKPEVELSVIRNFLPDTPEPVRPSKRIPHLIGYVGRLHDEQKQVHFLPEILAKLPSDYRLRIYYPHNEGGDSELTNRGRVLVDEAARRLGVSDRIEYVADVTDPAILYSEIDCLLLCSHHEGMPIVMLEAARAGIPFVVPFHLGLFSDAQVVAGLPGLVVWGASPNPRLRDAANYANAVRGACDRIAMSTRPDPVEWFRREYSEAAWRSPDNPQGLRGVLRILGAEESEGLSQWEPPRVTVGLRLHIGANEDWFKVALDSLQNQIYKRFITVLVIDGMESDAVKWAEKYGLPFVCTGKRPHSVNMSDCHRLLVDKCQTEFYKPLDYDDLLSPSYLRTAVAEMDAHCADLWACKVNHIDHAGMPVSVDWQSHLIDDLKSEDIEKNPLYHVSVLLRTAKLREAGGYAEAARYYGEDDWSVWIRMMRAGARIHKDDRKLVSYRANSSVCRDIYGKDVLTDDRLIYRDTREELPNALVVLPDLGLGGVQALVSRQLDMLTPLEKSHVLIGTGPNAEGHYAGAYKAYKQAGKIITPDDMDRVLCRYPGVKTIYFDEAASWVLYSHHYDYFIQHGIRMLMQFHGTMEYQQKYIVEFAEKTAGSGLSRLVVATENDRDFYTKLLKNKNLNLPITILKNVAPVYIESGQGRDALRSTFGLKSNDIAAVFIGRLTPHKAPYNAVSIAIAEHARNPRFKLFIIGGPDEKRDAPDDQTARDIGRMLDEQVATADAGEYIIRLGARTDLENILPAMDMMLVSSEYESCSIAQITCQQAGLPIVAPDTGANRSVVTPGKTGEVYDYHTCPEGNPEIIPIAPEHVASALGAIGKVLAHRAEYSEAARASGEQWTLRNRILTDSGTLRWILFGHP